MTTYTSSNTAKRVVVFTVPNNQILDVTGPLEVFSRADRWLRDNREVDGVSFQVEVASLGDGPVTMSSGLQLVASDYRKIGPIDTLLVAGGTGAETTVLSPDLIDWLQTQYQAVRRMGSVCTGAFILAQAGLLSGRQVTTHWAYCKQLQQDYPDVVLHPDAIYLRDGKLFTSAGVTAGMDLALALVEEDWGSRVALAVAQQLVMFLKRPGGQSQFSPLLCAQQSTSHGFEALKLWIVQHLGADLAVPALAEKASMSPRNFSRSFSRETGVTPAKFVEMARVDAARRLLEESDLSMEEIASATGLGCAETMRRAFRRQVSVSPDDYRGRFRRCFKAPAQTV